MSSFLSNKYFKWGILFLFTSLFWIYIFAASILAAMPTTALSSLSDGNSLKIITWFPQGWGFFSKDPKEPQLRIVNMSDGNLAPLWPNNIPKNLFGIQRLGRSQGIEGGYLISKIPESSRIPCTTDPYSCLQESEPTLEILNDNPSPTICGDVGFTFQEPVPWAWSSSEQPIEMPSEVVRVNIQCSAK
ncbi:SdpA family antimicrobial peptide system protein [Paenibacillus sp. KS-LC4]|uniref:SdpA family antimicrobial peptide system protein n=1 Tax=Paenibacillus sp. KS-LC4 TaxID=2979727 RepID=UPI0030D5DA40